MRLQTGLDWLALMAIVIGGLVLLAIIVRVFLSGVRDAR